MAAVGRKPTAAELAELDGETPASASSGPSIGRAASAEEMAELEGPGEPAAPPAPQLNPRTGMPFPYEPPTETDLATPPPPTVSGGEALARGGAQGASLGFADEASAVLKTYGINVGTISAGGVPSSYADAAIKRQRAGDPTGMRTYRALRDDARVSDKAAAEQHPKTYLGGALAGGLLAPGSAARGATGAAVVGRGAASGAAQGLGSGTAEVTQGEVGDAVKNVAIGGAIGGVIAGGGEGARAAIKAVSGSIKESLKRRVLNEVAEGTGNVGQTERKRLAAAGNAIVREVVDGPDAKTVRAAYSGGDAQKGRDAIRPIVDRLNDANTRAYETFERAGRHGVRMDDYLGKVAAARREALDAGDSRLADGLEEVAGRFKRVADEMEGMTLTRLRGLTSEAQTTAANKLGSLLERQNAKDARRVQAVVTEAMDETLTEASKGSRQLVAAANRIRRNNKRIHPLLVIDDALEVRARKEASGKSAIVRAAESVGTSAAAGGAIGAIGSDSGDKLTGILEGAAVGAALRKGLPATARGIDRATTTAAISAARGRLPALSTATRFAGAIGRVGTVRKQHEED